MCRRVSVRACVGVHMCCACANVRCNLAHVLLIELFARCSVWRAWRNAVAQPRQCLSRVILAGNANTGMDPDMPVGPDLHRCRMQSVGPNYPGNILLISFTLAAGASCACTCVYDTRWARYVVRLHTTARLPGNAESEEQPQAKRCHECVREWLHLS